MCGFKVGGLAVALVIVALGTANAAPDGMPNAGRRALLEHETRRIVDVPLKSSAPVAVPWLGLAFATGLAASFLGTFYGMQRFAFGRLVERDGWREVTYRYRSSPLALKGETLSRMNGLLEELERLGAGLAPARTAAHVAATGGPAGVRPTPVVFARREEREEGVRANSVAVPPVPAAAAASPVAPVAMAPPAPAPAESRYARARRLLAEGLDFAAIQAQTGLKRAELDLLRGAPAFATAAAGRSRS